jgi:O-antigen ligase
MSAINARLASPVGSVHPVVLKRRLGDLLVIGLSALIPLVLGIGIAVQVSKPDYLLLIGIVAGALSVVALVLSPRYEVSLVLIVVYLGLLEGPAKLGIGGREATSVVRNILIFSVCLGVLLRLIVRKEKIRLPPLSAWVFAFVALVLVEALNPNTHGIVKALGGFRQQLQWVPFFFFGYVVFRSKDRFRKLFLLLGVIALANAVVNVYQTKIGPTGLASWGPGYRDLVFGTLEAGKAGGLSARTFSVEGIARVRPPGLGSDAGFGGGIGTLALAGTLALLATGSLRRRWPVLILCVGALVAIATGLGRLQVVGAVFDVIAFAALSLSAGRRVTRTIAALLAVLVVAIPAGLLLVSVSAKGTFQRYESIAPGRIAGGNNDEKGSSLSHIPSTIAAAPFGVGLGTVGAAAGFGGKQTELVNGHGVNAETQYNFITDELGLPGLVLWVALTGRLIVLALRRLRRVPDIELRLYLAAIVSTFIAFTLMGFGGPTMASPAFGPFFWLSAGIAAYWFAGPGRASRRLSATERSP